MVGNQSVVIPGRGGATKYFEMAYIYGNEEDEPLTSVRADLSVINLLGYQKATDLSEAFKQESQADYQKKLRENPNGMKGKIIIYTRSLKIISR